MITYSFSQSPQSADVLVVPLFDQKSLPTEIKELDKELGGLIAAVKESEEFTGKKGQQVTLHTAAQGKKKVLLVGLG